jgi:hypothetical protein
LLAREPGVYTPIHALIGRRIADRFALCLAREGQVEASRRADEASARASRLESRVRALSDELDERTGYRRVVGQSASWKQVLTQATQVAAVDGVAADLRAKGHECIAMPLDVRDEARRTVHRAELRRCPRISRPGCSATS